MSSTPNPASGSGRQRTEANIEAAVNNFMIPGFVFCLFTIFLCVLVWSRPDKATKETKLKVLRWPAVLQAWPLCVGGDHCCDWRASSDGQTFDL